jgi:hypothetical protein
MNASFNMLNVAIIEAISPALKLAVIFILESVVSVIKGSALKLLSFLRIFEGGNIFTDSINSHLLIGENPNYQLS